MTNEAEMMREALEPCPFCGASSAVIHPLPGPGLYALRNDSPYFGHCDCCGADGPGADNPSAALTAWNTRAERVGVEDLAYRVANAKLGEGPSVRCEGPTEFEIGIAGEWVRRVLAALQQGTGHEE